MALSFHSNLAIAYTLTVACNDFVHVRKLSANSDSNVIANILKLLLARMLEEETINTLETSPLQFG